MFPFSWAIELQLDKILRGIDQDPSSVQAAFEATDIGKAANDLLEVNPNLVPKFLVDLIRLKIGAGVTDEQLNLLCEETFKVVKVAAVNNVRGRLDDDEDFEEVHLDKEVTPSAVDIYLTVVNLKPRLQLAVALFKFLSQERTTSKQAQKQSKKPAEEFESPEQFLLDVRCMDEALASIEPDPKQILNNAYRRTWSDEVTTLSAYLKQLESLVARGSSSVDVREAVAKIKKNCSRAELVKVFFDHVMQKDVDDKIKKSVCADKSLKFLWLALKELDFTTGAKTFKHVLKTIEKVCREAGEVWARVKGVQECIVCQENLTEPIVLPCEHIGCKKCLEDYFKGKPKKICPKEGCKKALPEDFKFESHVDVDVAVTKHATFRSRLSQFFLDMLQRFVFVREKPPHQEIVDTLLSFIVTKDLPKDEANHRTKNLSPFRGDYIDSEPIIRSFVLQLLFRYDVKTIELNLGKFLNSKGQFVRDNDGQFLELCSMIVQCLEDSFLAAERKSSKGKKNLHTSSSLQHMKARIESAKDEANADDIAKALWNIALDRLALNAVATAINDQLTDELEQASMSDLLETAVDFVEAHPEKENLQKYIVRFIASKYQREAIAAWKKKELYPELLPRSLRNSRAERSPDVFLLIDSEKYQGIRKTLAMSFINGDFGPMDKLAQELQDEPMPWRLAFHYLTRVNPIQINDEAAFENFLGAHGWMVELWKRNNKLVCHSLDDKTHRHASVNNLLVHFRSAVVDNKLPAFLDIFRRLANDPSSCTDQLLPTMPHDETLEIKKAMESTETRHTMNPDGTLSWVKCKNGHAYAIGECGRPTHLSKCPCGAPIGGPSYNAFVDTGLALDKTERAAMMDETKPGHLLGAAVAGTRSTTEREIAGLDVAIVRFFIHLSMMEGSLVDPEDTSALIDPPLKEGDDVGDFIAGHLLLNLRQISDCLGKSENDVIILLHRLIISFCEDKSNSSGALPSKEAVRNWEGEFVKRYIQPGLAQLEDNIRHFEAAAAADADDVANELEEILQGKPDAAVDEGQSVLKLPQFWIPRDNLTIDRIESKVGGAKELMENCPFLAHFLKEEHLLSELVHLPRLIELSKFLVRTYNRQLEAAVTDKMTILEFLNRHMEANDRNCFQPIIELYLEILARQKQNLFNFNM